jgi:hypothetical protein
MATALETRLHEIIEQQVLFQNAQDLQGILRLMHQDSFAYAPSEQLLLRLFASYSLQFTLLGQKFIGVDEDLAYVRTSIKAEKIEGPEFKDNLTDSLVVFRCCNGEWKIWCQAPLLLTLL